MADEDHIRKKKADSDTICFT